MKKYYEYNLCQTVLISALLLLIYNSLYNIISELLIFYFFKTDYFLLFIALLFLVYTISLYVVYKTGIASFCRGRIFKKVFSLLFVSLSALKLGQYGINFYGGFLLNEFPEKSNYFVRLNGLAESFFILVNTLLIIVTGLYFSFKKSK